MERGASPFPGRPDMEKKMTGKRRRATLYEANAQYHKEEQARRRNEEKERTRIARALDIAFGTRKPDRHPDGQAKPNRLRP